MKVQSSETEQLRRFVDLTLPVHSGMSYFPGHIASDVTEYGDFDIEGWIASKLVLDSHLGTHIDAPSHFIPGGATLDDIPLEQLIGPAQVIRLPGLQEGQAISIDQLPEILRPRVLFATGWWKNLDDPELYLQKFPYISVAVAQHLLDAGVRLVGIDGPSVDYDHATHKRLLENGAVIVENMAYLDQIDDLCSISVLPLRIQGGDGSPVRAVAETSIRE